MTSRIPLHPAVVAATAILLGVTGCERDVTGLDPAPYPSGGEVFLDGFPPGMDFQAFGDSKVDALDIDFLDTYEGTRSMKISVPDAGNPTGGYAGGAFVTNPGRDLTGYDALTFWAKASMPVTLDLAGFGNDNTGTSEYVAVRTGLSVSTVWKRYVVPIPLAEKLTTERGLFQFADAPDDGVGYYLWFDEVQFEKLGTIAFPKPAIANQTANLRVGGTARVEGTSVTYDVSGSPVTVQASPGYFTFASSNPAVATVDAAGVIRAVGLGDATITAELGDLEADGAVTVVVSEAPPAPEEAAPTPTVPEADVISLFSDAYTDVPVSTWSADFDLADFADVEIAGNPTKEYTNLVFAAIEFLSPTVDATAMTHFHMDIWTPDPTAAPAAFKIKLVDFGPDGAFGGGDDSEHEITLDDTTTPAMATGQWASLDIPFADFTGLTGRANLAQLILSGDPNTIYVDNVYFWRTEGAGEPNVAAPTPTVPEADVVSMFSDAYTDVPVDRWTTDWDDTDFADVEVAGNPTKSSTRISPSPGSRRRRSRSTPRP